MRLIEVFIHRHQLYTADQQELVARNGLQQNEHLFLTLGSHLSHDVMLPGAFAQWRLFQHKKSGK